MSIYFIVGNRTIKIGYSKNPQRRFGRLQCENQFSLKMIGFIEGNVRLERAIHAHLAAHRAHGEWFYDCSQVRDVIGELIAYGGAAIGFQDVEAPAAPKKPRAVLARLNAEHAAILRSLAEPLSFDDTIKVAISRAASRAGLSYWRAFDIWYGKARRIDMEEDARLRMAAAEFSPLQGDHHDA